MNNIFENCIHQFITHLQERKPCEVFGMDELTREKCWIEKTSFSGLSFSDKVS